MPKDLSARELRAENAKLRSELRHARAALRSTTPSPSPSPKRTRRKAANAPPEPTKTHAALELEIAERKKIEAELREAEQEASDLIRFAPTAIYEIDFRGPRFTRVNDAMCEMFGYTCEELLATNPFDLMDADSQKVFRERIRATLAGEPADESVEYRVRVKNGQERFALLKTRLLYQKGKPIGAFVIAHDITEHRQAEQVVRESEEKYRALFENAMDAILVLDPVGPGKVLSANPAACRLFGYEERELLELNREALVDASDPRLAALMKQRDQPGPVTTQLTYKRKDGTRFTGELHRTLLHDSAGCLRAVSIVRDVTERARAEEALRVSEEKFSKAFRHSPNAITITRLSDGRIIEGNESAYQLFGYSPEEVVGKTTSDLQIWANPEDRQRLARGLASQGFIQNEEFVLLKKDKTRIFVILSAAVLAFDNQPCFLASFIDNTEKKLAEEARRQSEALLQAVLESTPDPVYIKDRTSRVLLANRALSQVAGKPLEEIIGKTDSEYYANPAAGQSLREHDLHVMASQTNAVFEETVPTPNGERTFLSTKSPYRNATGEMIGIVGISHDITERKRAEEAVAVAHQRTHEILESIQDGFFALDRAWRITYINQRAAMNVGTTPEELKGRNLWEKFPGTVGTVHETYYRQAMDERVPMHFETDGVLTEAAYDIRVYPSAEGISVYWLDITARKQIEQRLQQLNRELEHQKTRLLAANQDLESFSYSVSHDLRAPLGSIDGFTGMILKDYGAQLTPEVTHLLELVHENSQQMSRLIEALLLLSRTSRQALARQTVAPREIAEDVIQMLQPQLQGRQVEIDVADLPPCQADPVLLRQVYANLLSNAVKFTRNCTPAHIKVGCKTEQGETVYFIKDDGVGFDMDQAGRLFGVFQRLHGEEEYEGTGIGLAIVQRIVRRHGGRVWAEGEIGKGATFYFTV